MNNKNSKGAPLMKEAFNIARRKDITIDIGDKPYKKWMASSVNDLKPWVKLHINIQSQSQAIRESEHLNSLHAKNRTANPQRLPRLHDSQAQAELLPLQDKFNSEVTYEVCSWMVCGAGWYQRWYTA